MKLRIVPARTGLDWVKMGVRTFLRQPLAMSGLFLMFMAAVTLISAIPAIGPLLALALVPAATLGLMAATDEATRGRFPMPTLLVTAFRAGQQRARAMLVLGALYAVAALLVSFVTQWITPVVPSSTDAREVVMSPAFQRSVAVSMVLYVPIAALFWHAPALVHWHGVPPVKSLFFSGVACLRNLGAFVVYALGWTTVFVSVGLLLSAIGSLFGGAQVLAALMYPLAMILAAMFFTSILFSVQGCFEPDPPPDAQPPTVPPAA